MDAAAGGLDHPLFGLLLDWIQLKALPEPDSVNSRAVWTHGKVQDFVLMTWGE